MSAATDARRAAWFAHCATSPAWDGYEIPDLDELRVLADESSPAAAIEAAVAERVHA